MAFVTKALADPHGHGGTCTKPNSRGAREFGIGSVWECDVCRRRWRFVELGYDQRDGHWDRWEPVPVVRPSLT